MGHFKHSSTATATLKIMCDALDITYRTPKHDMATRWGSTNIMMQSYLDLRPAFDVGNELLFGTTLVSIKS